VTYYVGQMVTLTTSLTGTGTPPTMTLAVTKPDGTTTNPTVTGPTAITGGWSWSANVTVDQAGDWMYVFTASGTFVGVDEGQLHVIPSALRVVGLGEVKEHGNITSTANDRELLDFIGTAQQMIERLVGPTVPTTVTAEIHDSVRGRLWLRKTPVISVTSVTEYAGSIPYTTLTSSDWSLDPATGSLARLYGGWYSCWLGDTVQVTYKAGRQPIPEAIRWAAKELTIHLWRSTQAQRGGRGRGTEPVEVAAGFGLPNRVEDALEPYRPAPAVS
jgi:hypothetical protein